MKKRVKLFCTIALLCLCLATLVFGVYSAMDTTYKATGLVNYRVEQAFADIETRVYSTSKKFESDNDLRVQAQSFEGSDFETLNQMKNMDTDFTFNKEQIKNLDKGTDYTPTEDDYVDTYSTESFEDPKPLNLSLTYSASKARFTYFVIVKVTSKSSMPIYAYVPLSGEEPLYKAPSNSFVYKPSNYKTLPGKESVTYIVFAMSLDDMAEELTDEQFKYPVVITKDFDTVQDESSIIKQGPYISELELIRSTEDRQDITIDSEGGVVQTTFGSFQGIMDYSLVKLDVSNVPTGENIELTLFPYITAYGEVMPGAAVIQELMFAKSIYYTIEDILLHPEDVVDITDATYTLNSSTYAYEVSIPRTYLDDDGTMPLICGFICEYGIAEQLQTYYGVSTIDILITTNAHAVSSKITKIVEWAESSYSIQTPIIQDVAVTVDSFNDRSEDISKAFTYKNYRLGNIPADVEAIDLTITNNYADSVLILPNCKEKITVPLLLMVSETKDMINLRSFQKGSTTVNIPLTLDENGCMEFCAVYLYATEDVLDGQIIRTTTNTQYASILIPEQSSLFEFELTVDDDFNPGFIVTELKNQNLTVVTIPSYFNGLPVIELDSDVFYSNNNIVTIDFENDSMLKEFNGPNYCSNLTTINLYKCKNLKYFSGSFYGCSNLVNMKLPSSLEEISSVPQESSPWYKNNVINGIYTTDSGVKYAIKLPTGATSFDFNKVTVIADSFAHNATSLTTIKNLNSVKYIGSSAFYKAGVTNVVLPKTLKYISYSAFSNCKISSLSIAVDNPYFIDYGANCIVNRKTNEIIMGFASTNFAKLPSQVNTLGQYSFYYVEFDENFEIPDNITNFNYACLFYSKISKLTLSGDKKYDDWAFPYTNVGTLTIKASMSNIPQDFLDDVIVLENIVVESGHTRYSCTGNCLVDMSTNTLIKGTPTSVIPSTVTVIGDYAFYKLSNLTTIEIPDSVIEIGVNSFNYTGLTSIELPYGLKTIKENAFYDTQLTSITIPENVTTIGDSMIGGWNSNLTEINWNAKNITGFGDYFNKIAYSGNPNGMIINIGENVESIPYNFVSGNTNVRMVNIYSTKLTSIGDSAFNGCSNLAKVNYVGANRNGISIGANNTPLTNATWVYNYTNYEGSKVADGNLYYITDGDEIIVVGVVDPTVTTVEIKEGTTQIADFALAALSNIKKITLPETLTSIGIGAIAKLSSRAIINYNAKNIPTLYEEIFRYTDSTTVILNIGQNVESIPSQAFKTTSGVGVVNILGTKLANIGNNAFGNVSYSSLTVNYVGANRDGITIGENNTRLINATWNYNYTHISVEGEKVAYGNLYYVTDGTQTAVIGVVDTNVTDIVIKEGTTLIDNFAFAELSNITSVTIPESVTHIGMYAFGTFADLATINYNAKNATSISANAFSNSSSSRTRMIMSIGENVETIPTKAFYSLRGIKVINIYSTKLTKIGEQAFSGTELKKVNYVKANRNGLSIGNNNGYITFINWVYNYNLHTAEKAEDNGLYYVTNGSTITVVGVANTSLTNITIKSGTTHIADFAFAELMNITSVTIPESVVNVGAYAFYNCKGIKTINWNAKEVTMWDSCFSYAGANTTGITLNFGVNVTKVPDNLFGYYNYYGDGTDYTRIKTVNFLGTKVTAIGERAFGYCKILTDITIPSTVTRIGGCSFTYCESLTSINLPTGITGIAYHTFSYCYSLQSITIPSTVTGFGNDAFRSCKSLTSIIIPASVKSFDWYVFSYCTSLKSVTIQSTLIKNIERGLFMGCTALTDINIPSSVTSITYDAFSGCTSLKNITIPANVQTIGNTAFQNCTSLTTVNILSTVLTSIGNSTFNKCPSLTTVNYAGSNRNNITIGTNNDPLTNATWNYNYVG